MEKVNINLENIVKGKWYVFILKEYPQYHLVTFSQPEYRLFRKELYLGMNRMPNAQDYISILKETYIYSSEGYLEMVNEYYNVFILNKDKFYLDI